MTINFGEASVDLTDIIGALIALMSMLITSFVIPYIKEKLSAEKYEKLKTFVRVAVAAAEQIYGSGMGQQKKEYVISLLLSKGIVVDVDEITAMIESEVYKLTTEASAG